MRSQRNFVPLAVGIFALFVGAGAPLAAGLTLKCGRADVMNPKWKVPLTFVYAGGDSGPLNISGPFGDFSINVKRTSRPAGAETTGEALEGTVKARVKLPPLADLEACIEKARPPRVKAGRWGRFPQRSRCLPADAPAAARGRRGSSVTEDRLFQGSVERRGRIRGPQIQVRGRKPGPWRRDGRRAFACAVRAAKVTRSAEARALASSPSPT